MWAGLAWASEGPAAFAWAKAGGYSLLGGHKESAVFVLGPPCGAFCLAKDAGRGNAHIGDIFKRKFLFGGGLVIRALFCLCHCPIVAHFCWAFYTGLHSAGYFCYAIVPGKAFDFVRVIIEVKADCAFDYLVGGGRVKVAFEGAQRNIFGVGCIAY